MTNNPKAFSYISFFCVSILFINTSFIEKGFPSFRTNVVNDTSKGSVVYTVSVSASNKVLFTLSDTFYYYRDFIFEPIKTETTVQESKLFIEKDSVSSSNKNVKIDNKKSTTSKLSTNKILTSYLITNLNQKAGLEFNLSTPPLVNRSYEIYKEGNKANHKFIGFPLIKEMFLFKYSVDDFKVEKDTLINGEKCIIISTNKSIAVDNGGTLVNVIKTNLILMPSLKHMKFEFISKEITERFSGAVIRVDQWLENNTQNSFEFEYISGLNKAKEASIKYYINEFEKNKSILDTHKLR